MEEIKTKVNYVHRGTYVYDNGLVILNEELKAELITANPPLFKQEDRNVLKDEKNILKYLTAKKEEEC